MFQLQCGKSHFCERSRFGETVFHQGLFYLRRRYVYRFIDPLCMFELEEERDTLIVLHCQNKEVWKKPRHLEQVTLLKRARWKESNLCKLDHSIGGKSEAAFFHAL